MKFGGFKMKFKIFLSSVRKEFEIERAFIKQEIEHNCVLNRFFEVFTFEETSASGKNPVELYSHEVINSDIYIGLIGYDYGSVLEFGISATEYEYELFNKAHNDALVFIKNTDVRDKKVNDFIKKIKDEHSYQTFDNKYELFVEVCKSLADFLEKNLINYRAYDSELLLNSSCDDVDMEAVEMFFRVSDNKALKELRNSKGLDYVLSSINAGEFYDGEFKLNVAGALFFAKDVSKFNIPHEVKMVKFLDENDSKMFYSSKSNKSFLKLIAESEKFLHEHTRHFSEIIGFKRETHDEYPLKAIREALVNALAHRDYTINSASITFYIYPNRIEIKSPGRLKYPLKISNLADIDPIHRNKLICDIFANTKYMEHIGTGIKRMRNLMKDNGLKEPEFAEIGEFFRVIFRRNFLSEELGNLNKRQLSFLEGDVMEITIEGYEKLFSISKNTARKDLIQLSELNFLDKSKKGKSIVYKRI